MKDLAGNILNVGDKVAVMSGGRYQAFYLATVTRMTAKKVGVVPIEGDNGLTVGCVRALLLSDERLIDSGSCVRYIEP